MYVRNCRSGVLALLVLNLSTSWRIWRVVDQIYQKKESLDPLFVNVLLDLRDLSLYCPHSDPNKPLLRNS